MNNIILVIIHKSVSDSNAAILRERVKSLGKNFVLDEHHIFVETSLKTNDVHKNITGSDLQETSVLEVLVQNSEYGTWGRAKAGLWDWLKNPT